MAYTVLARRYRSGTFDEVIGQEHIAQTLKKAITSGRIAHAYLFCGTRGTGKTSTARILAKCLNCLSTEGPTPTPCNKCESCLGINRGDDIDVIEVDAASNTGVDNVRDIIENSRYRPARSRFKVYIIDEVHMLSKNAFNALLKTLEEPPSHVKFILATTEPEKVLPTILSRCQRYDFRNIPTREIAKHLRSIVDSEKIKADDDALLLVARAGAGSMRDSLSLLDRLLSVGEEHLSTELIEQLLGMPKAQRIAELGAAIGSGDVKAVITGVHQMIQSGLSADTLIASLVDHLRNLLILRTCGPDPELVDFTGIPTEVLQQQAARFDPATLSQDIAILEELRRNLRTTQAGRALVDATLVRLALADQFLPVDEMLEQVDAMPADPPQKKKPDLTPSPFSGGPAGPPVEPVRTEPVSIPPAPPTVDDEEDTDDALPAPGKVWTGPNLAELARAAVKPAPRAAPQPLAAANNLCDQLRQSLNPSIASLIGTASCTGVQNGRVTLRFPATESGSMGILQRNGKKDIVRDALTQLIGTEVALFFELDDPLPEAPPQAEAERTRAAPDRPRPVTSEPVQRAPAEERSALSPDERTALYNSDELFRTICDELAVDQIWK